MRQAIWVAAATISFLFTGMTAQAADCQMPAGAAGMIAEAGAALNQTRASSGLSTLRENATLAAVAQAHACWMAETGKFGHKGVNGSNSWRRVKASSYCASLAAENIALGQTSGAQVHASWMGSSGHKRNIMRRQTVDYGIGVAMLGGRPVWVALYAKPC